MSAFADAFVHLTALSEEHGDDVDKLLALYAVAEEEHMPMCLFASVRARRTVDAMADGSEPEDAIAGSVLFGVLAGVAFARELERERA